MVAAVMVSLTQSRPEKFPYPSPPNRAKPQVRQRFPTYFFIAES